MLNAEWTFKISSISNVVVHINFPLRVYTVGRTGINLIPRQCSVFSLQTYSLLRIWFYHHSSSHYFFSLKSPSQRRTLQRYLWQYKNAREKSTKIILQKVLTKGLTTFKVIKHLIVNLKGFFKDLLSIFLNRTSFYVLCLYLKDIKKT